MFERDVLLVLLTSADGFLSHAAILTMTENLAPLKSMGIFPTGFSGARMSFPFWRQDQALKSVERCWYNQEFLFSDPTDPHSIFTQTISSDPAVLLLTWTGLGKTNGMRASIVTTHGEMVVPKLLPRNGPSGTYSHF